VTFAFSHKSLEPVSLCGISNSFESLSRAEREVSYVLLTRAPLSPKGSFDLHVLGTPPTFILSQDQTLRLFLTEFSAVSLPYFFYRFGSLPVSISLSCC
jgi:hypothetical protein